MFHEVHRTGITPNDFLSNIFNCITNRIVRVIKCVTDPSSFTDCDTADTRKFHSVEKKNLTSSGISPAVCVGEGKAGLAGKEEVATSGEKLQRSKECREPVIHDLRIQNAAFGIGYG